MNRYTTMLAATLLSGALAACSNSKTAEDSAVEVKGMKCEFLPDGDTATIYGKGLTDVTVNFPGNLQAQVLPSSNDSVLNVVVPKGTSSGKLTFISKTDTVVSKFVFRDNRNIIVNFDDKLATWGGFDPQGDEGGYISSIMVDGSSKQLPAALPEGCDGNYALLYGIYKNSWSMDTQLWIQYMANVNEGGRGDNVSIAGPTYCGYPLSHLALKFEAYIPKEVAYKGIRTEIFFGPADAPDKHGRDRSPLYFWKPFEKSGSYCTEGWQTVTIPLTEFNHGIHSDVEKFPTPIDLKKAVNFSFVLFGDAEEANSPEIFMCVDNFRVVPISE